MKILLDTNAYAMMKRGESSVTTIVRESELVIFSSVVAGELLFGFRNGNRFSRNLSELEGFLQSPYVSFMPVSWVTADRFSRIAYQLKQAGRPIPTNDIWIAAHAMETGADLVTFDHHFSKIDGLPVQVLTLSE